MLIPAGLTVLAFAWLSASLFRLRSLPAHLTAVYLLAFGEVAFLAQCAHFFNLLNSPAFFLTGQILLLLAVGLAWRLLGRPDWLGPLRPLLAGASLRGLRRWPDLSLFALLVLAGTLVAAWLVYAVPPNNNDSISTHMSRVGYWLQYGSFHPWPTQKLWQIIYPVNAQVQILWLVLFTRSDRLVGLVQWFSQFAAAVSVFGLARLLKADRAQSAFAALVFLTFPIVNLQSSTTQNDLVTAALFAAAFYLFFYAARQRSTPAALLSGLALGLGIGTKQTVILMLPGFGLGILLAWLGFRQVDFRRLLAFSISTLVSFLLAGSAIFFINFAEYRNPLGPPEKVAESTASFQSPLTFLLVNSSRFLYQAADLGGLPESLVKSGIQLKAAIARPLFDLLGLPLESSAAVAHQHVFQYEMRQYLQEEQAWYGPIGFLVLVPLTLWGLISGIRRRDALRCAVFLAAVGFLVTIVLFKKGWSPTQGRYFMPVAAVSTPLLAFWLRRGWQRGLGWLLMALALGVMFRATFTNPAKPLRDIRAIYPPNPNIETIYKLDRVQLITLQSGGTAGLCRLVERDVPPDGSLGIATQDEYYQEYCFFGEHFTRHLTAVYPPERVSDSAWLREQGVEYLLVHEAQGYPAYLDPAFQALDRSGEWLLYRWRQP